jgi:hypothetical protein
MQWIRQVVLLLLLSHPSLDLQFSHGEECKFKRSRYAQVFMIENFNKRVHASENTIKYYKR